MIYIKQVRLKNWFNYRGEYEDNTIEFSSGVNFFCADNNAGKTKLFNALRWVLLDKVILQKKDVSITEENFSEVINRNYFNRLQAGIPYSMGVQIDYIKYTNEKGPTLGSSYRISKEWKGTKDSSGRITEEVLIPGRGNSWRKSTENFDVRKDFIAQQFSRYLFLEGEQLNTLIPFSGLGLKETIDDMTDISFFDRASRRGSAVLTALTRIHRDEELKTNHENKKLGELIKERQAIESSVEDFEEDKKAKEAQIMRLEERKDSLINIASKERERIKHIETLSKLDAQIDQETRIGTQLERLFFDLLVRKFKISGYLSKSMNREFLNIEYRNIIQGLSAEHRASLDSKIDEEKQQMVARLIKNQPGIEILREIVNGKKCFVCGTTPLSEQSTSYITEHVIPHFSGEIGSDDPKLKLFNAINQLINSAVSGQNNFREDLKSFKAHLDKIGENQQNIHTLETNKDAFISSVGGDPRFESDTKTSLIEFDEVNTAIKDLESDLRVLDANLARCKEKLKDIRESEKKLNPNNSVQLERFSSAISFQTKLNNKLLALRDKRYQEFCSELGMLATERLHRYFGNNPGVTDNSFIVKMDKTTSGNISFQIQVRDKNGLIMNDPGGAETSMRQYCVILSLLQLAKESTSQIGHFPFIVDAPISNLNADYRLQFYRNLLEESVNSQMIIMTYDLVSGVDSTHGTTSHLNEDGEKIKHLMTGNNFQNAGNLLLKRDRNSPTEIILSN